MALDKGILHGKEHRRSYMGSKAISKICRNHGGCEWCHMNRMHRFIKRANQMKKEMKDFERGILNE